MAIADAGFYRNQAGESVSVGAPVSAAVAGTRQYLPDESIVDAAGSVGALVVEVTGESTLAAAQRLGDGVACLLTVPDFYAFHRQQSDLRYGDRVIHSPGVPLFRNDQGDLLDRPYHAAFLTAAAPNLGAIVRNQRRHAAGVPDVLRRRARRVLQVAARHGHRTLVLGAWGCGVFRNDPTTVANAFAEAMRAVDQFDRVVFAVRSLLRLFQRRGAKRRRGL